MEQRIGAKTLLFLVIASAVWLSNIKTAYALFHEPKLETVQVTYGPYEGKDFLRHIQTIQGGVAKTSKPKLGYISNQIPNDNPSGYSGRNYSKEEVQDLIRSYSSQYGIDANLPLAIARCESGYRWDAGNSRSSARGVFQYLASTWANTPAGKAGMSVYDADANVRMAISSIALHGTSPWNSSKHCWSNN